MNPVLFLLALQAGAVAQPPGLSPRDSARLVERVRKAEEAYFLQWRRDWGESQVKLRARNDERPDTLRLLALTCGNPDLFGVTVDPDRPTDSTIDGLPRNLRQLSNASRGIMEYFGTVAHPHLIKSPGNVVAVTSDICPIWVSTQRQPNDARFGIDLELNLLKRAEMQYLHRRPLIALLDSAATKLPGDGWIAGQRVRMLLEQGDGRGAQAAAAACRADAWWCTALQGFTHYWVNDLLRADELFQEAMRLAPEETRCAWGNVALLLSPEDRLAYESMSCAARDSLNETIWWLSDPLFTEEGNDRRAEHFGRQVLSTLHGSLELDERWDWRPLKGGPARAELIQRYGWPTQMRFWGGILKMPNAPLAPVAGKIIPIDGTAATQMAIMIFQDTAPPGSQIPAALLNAGKNARLDGLIANDKALRESMSQLVSHNNVGQTTIEYWGPQFQTVPPLSAAKDPLKLADSVWRLGPDRWTEAQWDSTWWPREFYRRDAGPLLPLQYQVGFFRRGEGAILVAASAWTTDDFVPSPPKPALAVITAAAPNAGKHIAYDYADTTGFATVLLSVSSTPQLLGLELVSSRVRGPARRARFGVDPPPPLSRLGRGEVALSDILLLSPDSSADAPAGIPQAMRRMLPTTLVKAERTGLFWEMYGLTPSDTAEVSLRLTWQSAGLMSRARSIVGMGGSRDSLTIRWQAIPRGAAASVGDVSIRPAGLVIDLTPMKPGEYELQVVVKPRGAAPAIGTRRFTIVR
jgi:hypothetical protein